MTRHTEIIAPIGDGTWWLVQCHTCRTLWPAMPSQHRAEEVRDGHEADHADGTVTSPRLDRLHKSLGGAS